MSLLFTEHEKGLPVSKSLCLHYRYTSSKKPGRLFYRSAEIEVTSAYYSLLCRRNAYRGNIPLRAFRPGYSPGYNCIKKDPSAPVRTR